MTKAAEPKKILIVDDDPTISEILTNKFNNNGFEAHALLNSAEVIFQAEQLHPDLIILDLMMTKLSGEDALKALKMHAKLNPVPVVIFSNKGTEDDLEYLYDVGAAKCLIKSNTSLDELVAEVKKILKV